MGIEKVLLIILSGLGIFHGLFFGILLWNSKANNISNRILSLLVIVLSMRVGKSVILAFTDRLPMLYVYLGLCLMMFIGPLFLIYSQALIEKPKLIKKTELLHFVPGVTFMFFSVPMEIIGFKYVSVYVAAALYIAIYIHYVVYMIYVKLRVIGQLKSGSPNQEVKQWLNILLIGLIAIWVEYVLNLFEESIPYILGPIVYSLVVYIITYLAFKRNYLPAVNSVKYQSTSFTDEEVGSLYKNIEQLMEENKVFLDPNLTLAALGKQLMVSPQKISFVINSKAGYNFNEYVNRFRVNHAVQLINSLGSKSFTIAAISFDCGFNSLSTFNTAFKKFTGKTPSAYRSEIN